MSAADDDDSQLSLLDRVSSKFVSGRDSNNTNNLNTHEDDDVHMRSFSNGTRTESNAAEPRRAEYLASVAARPADDLDFAAAPGPVERQQFLVERLNIGIAAVALCVLLAAIGVVLRYSPLDSDAGRFFIAAGAYGVVAAASNFFAVKVLLLTMFLAKHERLLQSAVRDIVMNLFFAKHNIETEVRTGVQRYLKTLSLYSTVQRLISRDDVASVVDRKLAELERTPEGVLFASVGMPMRSLRHLVVPAVLSVAAEVGPSVERQLALADALTTDSIHAVISRAVAMRAEALNVSDLRSIVAGVLSPHLSILVLWGAAFGIVLGCLSETFHFSRIIADGS